MNSKEIKFSDIAANGYNLSAKCYVDKPKEEPVKVLFICNGLYSSMNMFLKECRRLDLQFERVCAGIWLIENAEVMFRVNSFRSIAGQRVDVLVNWTDDTEREIVLSHSKHREWSRNIKYESNLLDMLCAMRNERLNTEK